MSSPSPHRLRPAGGYRRLRSFQAATLIYDGTVAFCDRHLDRRSRTLDQMVQAARSGRQNIAEGNRMGLTSTKSELHLTNVARASLEELLLDFEDHLRQRRLPLWSPDSSEANAVRDAIRNLTPGSPLCLPGDAGDRARWDHYARWLDQPDPAIAANALICLIHQANYLLDQQILSLEQKFIQKGGYSEALTAARLNAGNGTDPSDPTHSRHPSNPSDPSPPPTCPQCSAPMGRRTARSGPSRGQAFWGCTRFPECRGIVPLHA